MVEIEINYSMDNQFYLFSVKDNGQGIEKSKLENIFDIFVTLGIKDRFNSMGTGIGLSTVKKLVEKLGGVIYVNSELGVGSDFRFTIKK